MRQKLILLLLIVGLVPTLAMGIVAYTTLSSNLTNKSVEQVDSTATRQTERLDNLLQGDQEAITQLLYSYDFQTALGQYFQSDPIQGQANVTAQLKKAVSVSADLLAIHMATPQGKVWASTITSVVDRQLPSGDYSVVPGEVSKTQIKSDPDDGIIKLYITVPLTFEKKAGAVALVQLRLDKLVAAVEDYTGLGSTGETIIVNPADPKAVSLFPLRFDSDAALKHDLSSLQLASHPNTVTKNITDYRSKPVIMSSKSLSVTNWILATKIDQAEALAPIIDLRNAIMIIFLITSIVIILLAMYFARSFTAPIIALTERTRRMMNGDFTHPIKISSSDEVGALALTFNTMAAKLEESYKILEGKVIDRTRDLQEKIGELRNTHAKDAAILSSIGDGVVVTDKSGQVLIMNAIAGELLNLDPVAAQGKNISGLYTLYDDAGAIIDTDNGPTQQALQTREKVTQEVIVKAEANIKHALSVIATPVLQQDEVIGAIQTIRDVTKEKEIDRMKTEFISLASHQLRTPLSAIKWFDEMLVNGDAGQLTEEQTDFAKNIQESTERMIALVNSLLNISRIESGRIMIVPQPTDLQELVTGIINDLKAKIEERHQTIVISIHKGLPKINLDPRLISQVYMNLLTNAIKYTPQGGEISVFVSRAGDQLVSQVTDNGYGIPAGQQGKIFQKFFRAANAVKVETDGTGLGLYLIKAVVESSGGKIWFKSEENKGTTFWFTIPMSGMKAKEGEVSLDN